MGTRYHLSTKELAICTCAPTEAELLHPITEQLIAGLPVILFQ